MTWDLDHFAALPEAVSYFKPSISRNSRKVPNCKLLTLSEMQGRARVVSRQLQCLKTVMFMHFILDVLDECSILSLAFQKDSTTLTTVTTALEWVELGLSAMIGRPAKHLHEYLEKCVTVGDTNTFKEVELKGDRETNIAALSSAKSRVIEKVLQFFSSCFSSLNMHAVLKSGTIFNHKTWLENLQELETYGQEALHTLLEHFQSPLEKIGCNLAEAEQEWATMKVYIFTHLRMLQYEILWQRMLTEHTKECFNVG